MSINTMNDRWKLRHKLKRNPLFLMEAGFAIALVMTNEKSERISSWLYGLFIGFRRNLDIDALLLKSC